MDIVVFHATEKCLKLKISMVNLLLLTEKKLFIFLTAEYQNNSKNPFSRIENKH